MGQVTILKCRKTLESNRRNEYSANKTIVSSGEEDMGCESSTLLLRVRVGTD
uniref:Uncharacterized protein n=1 Tax=Nelumbo nucifera TaxID=4432 RepID=A0A822YSM9_NELNU|nr:TPA_asm: hypothetical protein HUJ06_005743 [Nelumbo nucifera]